MTADLQNTSSTEESSSGGLTSPPESDSPKEKKPSSSSGLKTHNQKGETKDLIKEFELSQQKDKVPEVYVGDTVKVGVRISEGNKERVQPYEGVVIAKRHGGINQTITVRRIFQGVGVERVFMVHSPQVASIKVERRGKVRRAKLFYLRERVGKATRVKQRFDR
ncbi:50S ribosomal protein L19 [Prochlorococcus marinus]|uniref:Large ribosomal subunit protein bL19 n=1 Tax=Prochlorococcus marinus (strain MIT 9211) TaxID=93059 RepID=A9BE97_PROM4|nr:50S ribosomal protein L19 [Prochlorococcus marinus]ABX08407.1 Ribosomal protein L19 [Prochlorococcus marinus str. MIT 9211]